MVSDDVVLFFRRNIGQFDELVYYLTQFFEVKDDERNEFMKAYEKGHGYIKPELQEKYYQTTALTSNQVQLFFGAGISEQRIFNLVKDAQEGRIGAPREIVNLAQEIGGQDVLWKNLSADRVTFSVYYMSLYKQVYKNLKRDQAQAPSSVQRSKSARLFEREAGLDRQNPVVVVDRTTGAESDARFAAIAEQIGVGRRSRTPQKKNKFQSDL